MRTLKIAVLCILLGVGPAVAGGLTPEEEAFILQRQIDGADDYVPPGGLAFRGAREPTQDQATLYVPLTEEQQELPTMAVDPGLDYYPGIEAPATAPARKQITEQVPSQ